MLITRLVLTSFFFISLVGCHKKQQAASATETTTDSAKVETEVFDLGSRSVDDYKAAVTKFQQGDGPLPVLPFGQVSFSGAITIIGQTTVATPPTGVALRQAVRNAVDNAGIAPTDDQSTDALPRCKVCEGDQDTIPAFGSPTPSPSTSETPSPTTSPTATPTPSPSETDGPRTSASPTPSAGVVVSKVQVRNNRNAFGRNCLLGCPAGFFPTVFSFRNGNQFFVASVCSDLVPSTVCQVRYANLNTCIYHSNGAFACAFPPIGVSAIIGIECH